MIVYYGIWNCMQKRWQFGICEPGKKLAWKRLYDKIGDDARKWRFQVRKLDAKELAKRMSFKQHESPRLKCIARCPESAGKPCIDTEDGIRRREESGRDYCPCGNTPEWIYINEALESKKELNNMALKKRVESVGAAAVLPLPKTFVVIDFETATLGDKVDPSVDLPIELAAVRFTEGEVVATLNFMIQQDIETLNPKVTELTGHTLEDVRRGIPEQLAMRLLVDFIDWHDAGAWYTNEHPVIVGQNVLFDYEIFTRAVNRNFRFIAGEDIACATDYNAQHSLYDTLTIGRDRTPYPHRLMNLCQRYGVTLGDWHSAIADAIATGQLFLAMHEEDKTLPKGSKQVAEYKNVIGYKKQYGVPTWVPSWVTIKPQGNVIIDENKKGAGSNA